jgi:hypothetical protein
VNETQSKKNINSNESINLSNIDCVTMMSPFSHHSKKKSQIKKENINMNKIDKEKSFSNDVKKKINQLINGSTSSLYIKDNSTKSSLSIDPRDSVMSNRSYSNFRNGFNNVNNKVKYLFI